MGNMDDEELEEACRVLVAVLAAIEAGELEASPAQVGGLVGAIEVLKALHHSTI
jgi:hypothetical protein